MSAAPLLSPAARFANRELSWIAFNRRVLAEAQRDATPLLERLFFCAIVSGNLDEFFMVRVPLWQRALEKGTGGLDPDGLTPGAVLERIAKETKALVADQYACLLESLIPRLREEGIDVVRTDAYTEDDRGFLARYFEDQVLPVLTPLAVDPSHPFPLLASCAVYILFRVRPRGDAGDFYAQTDTVLVQMPPNLNRFLRLPARDGRTRIGLLNDVIILFAGRLLGGYEIEGGYPFRVTRDADYSLDEEQAEDLLVAIEQELRSRRRGVPVRLEAGDWVPAQIVGYLRERLGLSEEDIYRVPSFLDLRSLFGFLSLVNRPGLRFPPWPPQPHPRLSKAEDLFAAVREADALLHHPYQAFDPVVDLVAAAAADPEVLAIKMTLYRVSGDSPIIRSLIQAAEAGKQVTAIVELRARFDEEANIQWARRLDAAGAHVIYGVVGYKIHAKALLVVRREPEGIRRYVHLSTGNYNDKTARVYTDLGYLSARADLGADISAFFNVVTGYSLPPAWNHIEIAPTGLKRRFLALIEREIEKHTPETPGLIRAKMNALIHPEVIEALYRASAAGVRIELVVRGLCRLRPGVPGLSERIRLVSVVDRFLEHSRIYHFRNGGNDEVYLSSADWMERNLDRRIELLFPVLDPAARAEVLSVLDSVLADNTQAWLLTDERYERLRAGEGEEARRSQESLYQRLRRAAEAPERTPDRVFQTRSRPRGRARG